MTSELFKIVNCNPNSDGELFLGVVDGERVGIVHFSAQSVDEVVRALNAGVQDGSIHWKIVTEEYELVAGYKS